MAWTVIGPSSHKDKDLCRCECGTVKEVRRNHRNSGASTSCGCIRDRVISSLKKKHGGVGTRLYHIYANMRQRCLNPANTRAHRYGARGITICPEWLSGFAAFKEWAESHGYAPDLTIDRIDNDGPYSPDNCRWASVKEQSLNRIGTLGLKDGRPGCVVARENGINDQTFVVRVSRGWSVEEACTTPPRSARR